MLQEHLVIKWFTRNPPCMEWSHSCRTLLDSLNTPGPCKRDRNSLHYTYITTHSSTVRQPAHLSCLNRSNGQRSWFHILYKCWLTCPRWRVYHVSGSSAESPVYAEIRCQRGVHGKPGTVVHLQNKQMRCYSVLASTEIDVGIDRLWQLHVKLP